MSFTSEIHEVKQAEVYMDKPASVKAVKAIFAVLDKGKFMAYGDFVKAFIEAGYTERLANIRADQFVLVNTHSRHWSPFVSWPNADGTKTYALSHTRLLAHQR